MADQKLTALTEETTPVAADVMYIVIDTGGTPLPRKIQMSNVFDAITTGALTENKAWVGNGSNNPAEIDFISAETAWTPSTTGITLGNGSITATYVRIGGYIAARINFILGSTSAITGTVGFSPPVTMAGDFGLPVGNCVYRDTGASEQYLGTPIFGTSTNASLRALDASATYLEQVALSSSIPFTWADTDEILLSLWYLAA